MARIWSARSLSCSCQRAGSGAGSCGLLDHPLENQLEQLLLVPHVPVDGRGPGAELLAHPAHRQAVHAVGVDDPQRRVDDGLAGSAARGPADLARPAPGRLGEASMIPTRRVGASSAMSTTVRTCQNIIRVTRTMFDNTSISHTRMRVSIGIEQTFDEDEGRCQMALIIEAKGLTKRFGKTQALDGLDLTAESGQVVALLGPNGAGKTTFIRTVATLLRPDRGRAAGRRSRRSPRGAPPSGAHRPGRAVRRHRARHDRAGEPGDWSPGCSARTARAPKANASSVLEPLGLTEAGDRLVRTYSGGMRRKLDLGASLVGAPQLLLLDEPTTGLDPRSRIELWDAIRTLVEAGHRRPAHHPVPGRGRQPGQPRRDHRPRPGGRRRDAGRAEAPDRRQGHRGARPARR